MTPKSPQERRSFQDLDQSKREPSQGCPNFLIKILPLFAHAQSLLITND
jgi:hypothetical protein